MLKNIDMLENRFYELYGGGEASVFFSPSRINIIGEHTDYNGGLVLPGAIEMGTCGVARKRPDHTLKMASANVDLKVEIPVENMAYDSGHGWANYVKGVIREFDISGYVTGGMEILVGGDIPIGAGLSSSASLEMLVGEMLNSLFNGGRISKTEMIRMCLNAENNFIGVMCGIMDQFAIGMGRKDKCILLDCDTQEYEYIDFCMNGHVLVIMNTNKHRKLNESKYNERRAQCETALKEIRKHRDIRNLCQLSAGEFEEYGGDIGDPVIRNRARHVVYENERVKKAADALKNGEIKTLGELIDQSHTSLRDLYEVTGPHLDSIVEAAAGHEGCIGARMTGGGFGGCAIAIVRKDRVDDFMRHVAGRYRDKTGFQADFYTTGIGDGARIITSHTL
ncbi:MAG TPA: galactokinase [Bacillota bacterium]|nr:galactokinase [Bacillota bacterium]